MSDLTDLELKLFDSLPGPPVVGSVRRPDVVCIVEWLPPDDRATGTELSEWLDERRSGFATLARCGSKQEVLDAIHRAKDRAQERHLVPLVHLEAHGGPRGLEGPDGNGGLEFLEWDELTSSLQELNVATRCNVLLFAAACTGYAAVQALTRGPKAPAVAIVGPDAKILPHDLLMGTKEFYRRLMDPSPDLSSAARSASIEAGTVAFEPEAFAVLAFDAAAQVLIVRLRDSMLDRDQLAAHFQQAWDEMFMLDICPENRERFNVNFRQTISLIDAARSAQNSS